MEQTSPRVRVVGSSDRTAWQRLLDPPGAIPSAGAERETFTSLDGRFTTGLWEREPDTWSFERSYDEVALILEGRAEIEGPDGSIVEVVPGDVLITPRGSTGTWRVHEKLVKFYAIYAD